MVIVSFFMELISTRSANLAQERVCWHRPEFALEMASRLGEEQQQMLDPEIESKIEERNSARRDRNFDRADQIRKELAARGIILEDTPQGTKWKRK